LGFINYEGVRNSEFQEIGRISGTVELAAQDTRAQGFSPVGEISSVEHRQVFTVIRYNGRKVPNFSYNPK
jgi:hypothetical protein